MTIQVEKLTANKADEAYQLYETVRSSTESLSSLQRPRHGAEPTGSNQNRLRRAGDVIHTLRR